MYCYDNWIIAFHRCIHLITLWYWCFILLQIFFIKVANWLLCVPHTLKFVNLCFVHRAHLCVLYLTTNSDYFPIQRKLVGFYNRAGVCLLRGTDCIFKYYLDKIHASKC
jgi:hypothetical protein